VKLNDFSKIMARLKGHLNVYPERDLEQKIRCLAQIEGVSISALLLRIVSEYVDNALDEGAFEIALAERLAKNTREIVSLKQQNKAA
jgi:hypothetical protein